MRSGATDPDAAPTVTSTSNPRVKALIRLRKRASRDERALTLVEGHDELVLALDGGAHPLELFFDPAAVRPEQAADLDRIAALGAQLTPVGRAVLEKVAYRQSPDGWLAVLPTPGSSLHQLPAGGLGPDPLFLVCEGIEKPGNLGALLRTAEAAGVSAVISASGVTDFGNPNVVRASKGAVFAVPLAAASSAEVLAWLRTAGVRVVVSTPAATTALPDVDLTGPLAVVVGSESAGVTTTWLEQGDVTTVIPMHGRVNSLNAAASGAVLLYEANRQRRR